MSLESVGSNYLYSPSILDFVLQKRFTISRLSNESEFTHLLCRSNTHFVQLQNSDNLFVKRRDGSVVR